MPSINLVMSSSSTKFPIHLGFVSGLFNSGIEINEAVGTSGGGLVLGLVKCGWNIDDLITEMYKVDFNSYISLNWWKYLLGYFRGFFVKNKNLIELFNRLASNKLLKDVDKLTLLAVDLEKDVTVALSKDKYPDMPLAKAIMSTICIPGFFEPVIMDSMYLVDGGIRESIGIDYIKDEVLPTVVVIINSKSKNEGIYRNLFEVWLDSIDNLFDANREKGVREGKRRNFHIVEIPYNLPFNQFDVSIDLKREMVKLGFERAVELSKQIKF